MSESFAWPESRWISPDLDWREAQLITAGVDVGSVSTQAVVMLDGELYCYCNIHTGSESAKSAQRAMQWALEQTGLSVEKIHYIIGTGYGRVNVPFAGRTVTEIACHAKGANFIYGPSVRTILDMGGQDCKAIRCDHEGKVLSFLMNDKCAAGTGRGMEVLAELMGLGLQEMGELSLRVKEEPPPVSSTCVVFAKSEASRLLRSGWPKERVLAAYCSAMARKVVLMLERIGVEKEFAVTGGIAKNPGVVRRIEREIGLRSLKPRYDTQLAGAIGAALLAKSILEKNRQV